MKCEEINSSIAGGTANASKVAQASEAANASNAAQLVHLLMFPWLRRLVHLFMFLRLHWLVDLLIFSQASHTAVYSNVSQTTKVVRSANVYHAAQAC